MALLSYYENSNADLNRAMVNEDFKASNGKIFTIVYDDRTEYLYFFLREYVEEPHDNLFFRVRKHGSVFGDTMCIGLMGPGFNDEFGNEPDTNRICYTAETSRLILEWNKTKGEDWIKFLMQPFYHFIQHLDILLASYQNWNTVEIICDDEGQLSETKDIVLPDTEEKIKCYVLLTNYYTNLARLNDEHDLLVKSIKDEKMEDDLSLRVKTISLREDIERVKGLIKRMFEKIDLFNGYKPAQPTTTTGLSHYSTNDFCMVIANAVDEEVVNSPIEEEEEDDLTVNY